MTEAKSMDSKPQRDDSQVLTAHIAGQVFGINVAPIKDVFQAKTITPVPLAPPHVKGMINFRGHIIPSLDLRKLLGLPKQRSESQLVNVAVEHKGHLYSLLVDSAKEVITLPKKAFEKQFQILEENLKPYASGVYKSGKEIIIVLDLDKILKVPDVPKR